MIENHIKTEYGIIDLKIIYVEYGESLSINYYMKKIINEACKVPRSKIREMFDYWAEIEEFYRQHDPDNVQCHYAKAVYSTLWNLFEDKVLPDNVTGMQEYIESLNNLDLKNVPISVLGITTDK